MSSKMIIDAHHHYQQTPGYVDRLAEEYARIGIARVCLISLDDTAVGITDLFTAAKKFPDFILPLPMFNWQSHTPEDIVRFKEMGAAGVKFIQPSRPYNDKKWWLVYEKCQELNLPGLFHLGIVGLPPASGIFRASSAEDAKQAYYVDSNFMRPIYLDTLARLFPEWQIHGAHLGNPWYEEATMSCRWNQNLYFDLTGSTLKKKKPAFFSELLWWTPFTRYRDPDGRDAWEKIVFGSDVAYWETRDVLSDYDHVIRELHLSEDIRWKILGGTAAKIYGLDDGTNDS